VASAATERFSPPFQRSTGEGPAFSPPHGTLVIAPSAQMSRGRRPIILSNAARQRACNSAASPQRAQSLSRRPMVRSEHPAVAMHS
jgi:hypothetical protein